MARNENEEKLESEQKAIIRISNDTLICKDCLLRMDDSVIFGNTTSCEQYPNHTKPFSIIFEGKDCSYYVKE